MTSPNANESALKVLLVDDDVVDRLALRRALSVSGLSLEIIEVADASSGLEKLCEGVIDCAFLDYHLPGHDGLWLLREARLRGVGTPVIVLTGQGDEETAVELMKAGASDYLSKSALSPQRAAQCLRQALALHRAQLERGQLLEAERRARERAESEARMREELMAIVSHDLRNPLNAITMSASLLTRSLPADVPAPCHKYVQTILRSVDQMTRLIADLLDLSAIDRNALKLDRRPHAVATLIRESVELFQAVAASRGLLLNAAEVAADLRVSCDRERLQQVLSNLLGNALKFTPPGGQIRVGAKVADDDVRFTVSDTGPGIAGDQLEHLFDRYWQAKNDSRGVGLGLSIARGIVDAHSGRIWVETELGRGTDFHFTIPIGSVRSEVLARPKRGESPDPKASFLKSG